MKSKTELQEEASKVKIKQKEIDDLLSYLEKLREKNDYVPFCVCEPRCHLIVKHDFIIDHSHNGIVARSGKEYTSMDRMMAVTRAKTK